MDAADSPVRETVLEVEGLSAGYRGAIAISDVALKVGRGEVVALLGANGAGKTTMLRVLSGLHTEATGSWSLRGEEVRGLAAHELCRRGMAHVPEGRQLFGQMTVRENLEIGLFRTWPVGKDALDPAFELFPELTVLEHRRAYSLSGGEQQMVALARALLPGPDLVLLDEPSLGLAPVVVDRILEAIDVLRRDGTAVLLVEQDTEVALAASDRGYVLADGRVVASDSADQLRSDQALVRAYLGDDATA